MIDKITNEIFFGDCIELLKKIPDNSIDMILCDLPYGTTQCKWDTVLPMEELWIEYNRVCKERAAMVFTSAQPFTSSLVMSNVKYFKYTWVWEKSKATGYLNAKKMPMRAHEDICVFYRKPPTYNPQMVQGTPYDKGKAHRPTDVYGAQKGKIHVKSESGLRYPRTVQYFKTAESEGKVFHSTQKPLALFEYLIKTYTNEGELVLDNCIGSGTTALACINTNRNYVGMEIDPDFYNIAQERTKQALLNLEAEQ